MGTPSFIIGGIAKGDDFWNRAEEVENIWSALKNNSVLLKAPRRFGKTSIMDNLYEKPADGFKVFFMDTESVREPEEFISSLVALTLMDSTFRKLYKSANKLMEGLISRVEVGIGYEEMPEFRLGLKEAMKKDWQEEGKKLISHLEKYDGKILFILDELPELIKNIVRKRDNDTAIDFLHWFRAIRQMPNLSHIRWLVGGSIGIEHVIERIGAGLVTINDFENIGIGPFSEPEAREFMKGLLLNEGQLKRISGTVLDKLLDTIGAPIPYFIQILLREGLYEMRRQGRKTLNNEIIDHAYKERLLGPTNRTYFEHYYTRLKEYYDADNERIAKKLLLEIARRGNIKKSALLRLFKQESRGKINAEVFSYLMADLENDFYITFDVKEKTYGFATKVLRDWWLRYYDLVEE